MSLLNPAEAEELVKDRLWPGYEREAARLDLIDCWYRWSPEEIKLPRSATPEHRKLAELSRVPWLNLVVTACAQAMYVDGYRSGLDSSSDEQADPDARSSDTPSPPWELWLANAMDRRQIPLHRAALAYGYAFNTVLPGIDPLTGAKRAAVRSVSPRKAFAIWEDPADDDWPEYFMRVIEKHGATGARVRVFDDEAVHELVVDDAGEKVTYIGAPKRHDVGVCPVVRFAPMLDLDGRAAGEVEPFIPLAARINKTAYDRMLTQHFASWKVRYVTGMAEPDTEEEANRTKLKLRVEDILVAEDPDTKFGTLDATDLSGFISAYRADIETLAAASQTPTHELTGQMANLSAEALAAARASLNQKVTERQKPVGQSHAQTLRLACAIDGHEPWATDTTGRVTWQDMEIRSMSQAADALGKMVQMLGVPPTAAWGRIPGVEKTDVQEWIALAERGDPITKMQEDLDRRAAEAGARRSSSGSAIGRMDAPAPGFGQGSFGGGN